MYSMPALTPSIALTPSENTDEEMARAILTMPAAPPKLERHNAVYDFQGVSTMPTALTMPDDNQYNYIKSVYEKSFGINKDASSLKMPPFNEMIFDKDADAHITHIRNIFTEYDSVLSTENRVKIVSKLFSYMSNEGFDFIQRHDEFKQAVIMKANELNQVPEATPALQEIFDRLLKKMGDDKEPDIYYV